MSYQRRAKVAFNKFNCTPMDKPRSISRDRLHDVRMIELCVCTLQIIWYFNFLKAKRQLEPSWWEMNPRNTSLLGSECVLVDVNRQDEGKSAHLCLGFNVDLPASSFSSLSLVTPLPPPLSLSLSVSFPSLTKPFGERRTFSWHTTNSDQISIFVQDSSKGNPGAVLSVTVDRKQITFERVS